MATQNSAKANSGSAKAVSAKANSVTAKAMSAEQAAEYARVQNLEEIANRREAVKGQQESGGRRLALRNYDVQNGFTALPDECKRFKHELMLLAFTGPGYTKPCNPHAGVILMGSFGTDSDNQEEAFKQAQTFAVQTLAPAFRGADIRAVPMDKWTLIAKDAEHAANEQYCWSKMDDNMEAYYTVLKGNQKSFKRRVEESVKAIEQELQNAERELADAREKLDIAKREDTPQGKAKIQKLEQQLKDFKKTGRATTEPEEYKETVEALERQLSYHTSLVVSQCERNVKMWEKRHQDIRDRKIKAALKDKIQEQEQARMTHKSREAKQEHEKVAVMGLPVDEAKRKKVSAKLEAQRAKVLQEHSDWETLPAFPSHVLPRSQGFAAVCFLPDCTPGAAKGKVLGEPMVRILKTYRDRQLAEEDVQQNLSKYILDFDIDVVDMGEWLFPGVVDYDKIEQFQFRDEQQQEIMESRRREKKKVRDYETLCQQENLPSTELFIKEAQEGISMEEYYKQSQIQGTVDILE